LAIAPEVDPVSPDTRQAAFLTIDRVSKFTYVEFHDRTKMLNGTAVLENVIAAFPCAIHTILTDNGMAFADLPKSRSGVATPRTVGDDLP